MSEATILLRIGSDVSGLTKGLREARGGINDLNGDITLSAAKIEGAFVGAIAAAGAALAGLTAKGFAHIDAQRDLARQLDTTIDGLRAVQLAAKEGGVESETLTANMEKLNIALGKAANGGDKQRDAFASLGLSVKALAAIPADQRIEALADAMQKAHLTATEASTALAELGIKGGSELAAFLRDGGDAIRAARGEVEALGLSVSAVDATSIDRAGDAMAKMGLVFESVSNQLAIAFAPILEELATEFNDMSRANKGFGGIAVQVAQDVSKAFGYVADAVYFVRVGFDTLKAAGFTLAEGLIRGFDGLVTFWTGMVDHVIGGVNRMIEAFNSIAGTDLATIDPFSDSPFVQGLDALAQSAKERGAEARAALMEIATQPLPHTAIDEFWQHATERAQAASEAEVARQEAERETFAEHLALKQEITQASYQVELDSLAAQMALRNEVANSGEVDLTLAKSAEMTKQEQFANASWHAQVAIVSGSLAQMTQGVAQHSKAMFELNKAAGIANAIVNTAQGITTALANYPPPLSFVMAGLQAAAGAVQIAAISKQKFGSGGAAPSLAGSTPAPPVSPVGGGGGGGGGSGQVMRVEGINPGDFFTGKMVRGLAERLAEHQKDGGTVIFA
jgi:hypothetical protein